MRLLPQNNEMPPEEPGASFVEIDATALESQDADGQSLFDRLKQVAIAASPDLMRRAVDDGRQLKPEHLPVILMRVQGMRPAEIAGVLNIAPVTVYRILRSVPGQNLLTQLYAEAGIQMGDIGRTFQEAAPMAAEVLLELAETATKEETRLKAAFNILDRAGYGATKKSESVHKVEVSAVGVSAIAELREALQEALEVEADFEVIEQAPTPPSEDAA